MAEVSTFVGKLRCPGFKDAQGVNAQFTTAKVIYSNRENSLLVADFGNNVIRKVTMEGNKS